MQGSACTTCAMPLGCERRCMATWPFRWCTCKMLAGMRVLLGPQPHSLLALQGARQLSSFFDRLLRGGCSTLQAARQREGAMLPIACKSDRGGRLSRFASPAFSRSCWCWPVGVYPSRRNLVRACALLKEEATWAVAPVLHLRFLCFFLRTRAFVPTRPEFGFFFDSPMSAKFEGLRLANVGKVRRSSARHCWTELEEGTRPGGCHRRM